MCGKSHWMPIETRTCRSSEILRVLQVPRSLDRNALFQVMFLLQNAASRAPALAGLSAQFVDVDPGIARSDLLLELIDADERLCGWLEYSTDLFEAATIARMAAHLRTLLEAIVADPEERISRLALLPARNAGKSSSIGTTPRPVSARLAHLLRTVRSDRSSARPAP